MNEQVAIQTPPPPLTDPGTIDYIHTGPGTLAGTYLRLFWQPIYVSRKLEAGRAVPLTIMNQKLALYRSQDGKVHCVENRCAHRGALLSTGWVEGDVIRCPFHGWAFGPDGQCVHQPLEAAGYAKNIRIGGYPTREYLGLVFAYLGEGEPPEFPTYPEWENAKFVSAQIDTRPCNWFQNVENFQDEGHVFFTHRRSAFEDLDLTQIPKIKTEKTPWGLSQTSLFPDGRRRATLFGMPNIGMFAVHPDNIKRQGEERNAEESAWQMFLDYRVPVDDESHLQVHAIAVFIDGEPSEDYKKRWEDFSDAEAEAHEVAAKVLSGELPYDAIAEKCHHVPLAQDEVVQVGQGVIADRRRGIENLGASDTGIVAIRRLYTEELTALAEGRPLRTWERPEGLLPLGGAE
ncbi:ring-hydroxylating oxygenase subunit alpha [Sphingobium jiangsuense]|uniref:5,5'-dehydrodivanillate O-demethylase n=1 Tax=Sphingobium jiangsuense TaxID=870476 RepID=A0A7W6FQI1_9SPHN|nr:Rieske 2Fe-2S domain-containing protein [Sphingobium jiangsuense]MBB3926039.1 5,5'-dehydrodivanillate O-demethylase [Sphingobium jiangsuense]GLT00573.1 ring-hydroxylating oxygenase subunit alpha [Sphingobium jiangsuense]